MNSSRKPISAVYISIAMLSCTQPALGQSRITIDQSEVLFQDFVGKIPGASGQHFLIKPNGEVYVCGHTHSRKHPGKFLGCRSEGGAFALNYTRKYFLDQNRLAAENHQALKTEIDELKKENAELRQLLDERLSEIQNNFFQRIDDLQDANDR